MGVTKEIIKEGDGQTYPKQGDQLTMHYTGTLTNGGKQFDSSVSRGRPFQFVIGIGQVIQGMYRDAKIEVHISLSSFRSNLTLFPLFFPLIECRLLLLHNIIGWDEGVIQMSLGEKANLQISSDFGYGARGAPGAIPPNADLMFEVELLAIGTNKAPGFSDEGSYCHIM